MDDHYLKASWASLFLVTAFSSFLFSVILKLLDGSFSSPLLKVGAVSSLCALASWLFSLQKRAKNNPEKGMSSENSPGQLL